MRRDRKTVLVVDDDVIILTAITEILKPHYRVKACTHGERAIDIARRDDKPDLILLDFTLPGMSGRDVARKLAANVETAKIPVVFLSGNQPERALFEYGPQVLSWLCKPIDAAELLKHVGKVLGEADAASAESFQSARFAS